MMKARARAAGGAIMSIKDKQDEKESNGRITSPLAITMIMRCDAMDW
jgi:hypothetical protein